MTFIASVIAKDGVAIVADSFVTTQDWFIEWDDFRDLIALLFRPQKLHLPV